MSLNLPQIKSGALVTSPQYELLRTGNDPALYLPLDASAAAGTTIDLDVATLSFSGLSLQPALAAALSVATFQFIGQAITVLSSTVIALTSAVFTFTALAIEAAGSSPTVRQVRRMFRRFGALGRL